MAFLSNGDDFWYSRMVQFPENGNLTRQPSETRTTSCKVCTWCFDRDHLSGLPVNSLKDSGHPTSCDECCNFEAIVEKVSDFDFVTQTREHTPCGVKKSLRFHYCFLMVWKMRLGGFADHRNVQLNLG